ncbi:MAG: GNAT family N-acetyltransferase [Oscillospiraceae bacterium]|jgi:predicted N-acetyltransferase YhbS|nr:GNAT family N-acetyltransferase [Oscillospiraceae bacterium]
MIIIEQLKKSDIEEYKNLIDSCFGESNNTEEYDKYEEDNEKYVVLVAKDNSKVIGSITLYKIDLFTFGFQPALEIFNVCVLPEYRGQKISKKIFEEVFNFAKENKYKSIYLTCLETAYTAHKLYESLGFKKMSSIKYSIDL